MTQRILGPTGPERKRRLRLLIPLIGLCLILIGIGASSAGALTTSSPPSFTFVKDEDCSKTPACGDDQPGQKDLSAHAVANPSAGDLWVAWKWDDLSLSGGNTGDACALFDTGAPNVGRVNFAVCVTIAGNPAAQVAGTSPRIYTCGDGKVDRCTSTYTLVAKPYGTACAVNQAGVDRTDPWHSGQLDTTALCHIDLNDVGGGSAKLVNTCSYPSQQPTSDPSDCVLIPRDAFLTITKDAGTDTTTNFNFTVSGGATATPTVTGGSSTTVAIKSATATSVIETLPSTDWTFKSATCSGGTNNGTVATTGRTGITAASDTTVTCAFVNELKAAAVITIDKVCTPAAAADTDRFQPRDTVPDPDVNAGSPLECNTGTTTYSPAPDTAYTIREVASSGSLSNYTASYSAGCASTTGLARGTTGTTCTITNTLKEAGVITIDKVCTPSAAADTDRFQLRDTVADVNAGSPLECNTGTTTYSPAPDTAYTIREVASSGSLSNYTASYSAGCASTTGLARGTTGTTCTITNTLKEAGVITIDKVCTPAAHADTDRFQPRDTVADVNAGSPLECNTGTTTYSPAPDTAYTIREVASSGSLSNYTASYSAGCASTTGLARGTTGTTCTITNTLRTFTVVTFVCEGGQLYQSSVTFDGDTKTSLAHSALLPDGVDEQKLCSDITTGARFTGKKSGTKTGSVTITP